MSYPYDLIVIGAGPGGYVAAIRAAQYGMTVAVVEERQAGGTCLNRGCIPTKALMHTAHLYAEISACRELGIHVENVTFDIEKIYSRKHAVVDQLRSGVEFLLKANGVDRIQGHARITGHNRVSVTSANGEAHYTGTNLLLATGSLPSLPPIDGITLPGVITSNEILEQKGTAYASLVIIGGGVIGVEFATLFQALGCKVTILEAMDRILPTMDPEISQKLDRMLRQRGVAIYPSARVEKIERAAQGLRCLFSQQGELVEAQGESVLVSVGRRANLSALSEGSVPVTCERGVVVNEAFQTSTPSIYAIGDVIDGGIQLAHAASAQGCVAVAHMAGRHSDIRLSAIPSCIYTTPEIASVGITARQAREQGIDVLSGQFSMAGNGKSIIESQTNGFVKVVFEKESGILLGAQLLCARATDLVSEFCNAIANRQTIRQLSGVIRPHPTFSEAVSEAVDDAEGLAVHSPPKK